MKRINLLFLLLPFSTVMMAQEISIDVAKSRTFDFLSRQSVGPKYAKGTTSSIDLKLAYTSKSEGKTCFYVFNVGDDNGFVIAGGDEAALEILGYSDCGTFDYDTAPENFRWWLSQYTEQIAHAEAPSEEALAAVAAYRAKAAQTRDDIAPLMETYWKQDYPYNSEIPIYESNGARYVTGCVATAMAQVMKRWNYPEHGLGSYSY
ncbi:MAG: Spi family protease inhibitor, partial [Bacteroidales bacterium]|nr:Spi family protease inhibitor [Bacteroidales bacterium]